jgi:hypothetical protein
MDDRKHEGQEAIDKNIQIHLRNRLNSIKIHQRQNLRRGLEENYHFHLDYDGT